MNDTTRQDIREHRDTIKTTLNYIVVEMKNKPNYFLELSDTIFTLVKLKDILNNYLENKNKSLNDLKQALSAFFLKRWALIRNTPLDYSQTTEYSVNSICRMLVDEFARHERMQILMPTVISKEDIYTNNFNEMNVGEFILSDNQNFYISIKDMLEIAKARFNEDERDVFVCYDQSQKSRPLTDNELGRILKMHPDFQKLITLQQNYQKNDTGNIYRELLKLRDGLRQGDVKHTGTEHNAGAAANVALVDFKIFFDKLPANDREWLRRLTFDGNQLFGGIMDTLCKPLERYMSSGIAECIYMNGNKLERFILANRQRLEKNYNFSQMQREQFCRMVEELTQKIDKTYVFSNIKTYRAFDINHHFLTMSLLQLFQCPAGYVNQYTHLFGKLFALVSKMIEVTYDEQLKLPDHVKSNHPIRLQHIAAIDMLYAIAALATHFASHKLDNQSLYLSEIISRLSSLANVANGSKFVKDVYNEFSSSDPNKSIIKNISINFSPEISNRAFINMTTMERRVIPLAEKNPSIRNNPFLFYQSIANRAQPATEQPTVSVAQDKGKARIYD